MLFAAAGTTAAGLPVAAAVAATFAFAVLVAPEAAALISTATTATTATALALTILPVGPAATVLLRVLLARVLVSPADVLLLDEPLIALDPAWQRQVLIRLKQRAEAGQTVILSLHDLHLAAEFADKYILDVRQPRWAAQV